MLGNVRWLLPLFCVLLAACGAQESLDDADAQISTFHSDLNSAEYEMIWRETHPKMREAGSREDFVKFLTAVHTKLGKVKASKQVSWRVETNTSGKFTIVGRETTFEKGKGVETFTFSKVGEETKLVGYNINSTDMMLN